MRRRAPSPPAASTPRPRRSAAGAGFAQRRRTWVRLGKGWTHSMAPKTKLARSIAPGSGGEHDRQLCQFRRPERPVGPGALRKFAAKPEGDRPEDDRKGDQCGLNRETVDSLLPIWRSPRLRSPATAGPLRPERGRLSSPLRSSPRRAVTQCAARKEQPCHPHPPIPPPGRCRA